MQFNKIDTPSNFVFFNAVHIDTDTKISLEDCGSDVFRYRVASSRWSTGSGSHAELDTKEFNGISSEWKNGTAPGGTPSFSLQDVPFFQASPGGGFGVNGKKWMISFVADSAFRYYGAGGKNLGFELSGKRTLFWNTDVFADFHWHAIERGTVDPVYTAFPVLIIERRLDDGQSNWAGIIVNSPYPSFMNMGATEGIFTAGSTPFERSFYVGACDGEPDVFFTFSRSLQGVVRKLQTLQGRVPLPPSWALGHHQCRWGYRSASDLERIASEYEGRGIPNDGLWLDIDYMDGFRVFTVDATHFPDARKTIDDLHRRGFRVVPILDPGLKRDKGYAAYETAKELGVLCKNPEGGDYIGFVWPGYSVFPDFSLKEGRDFWADQVARFTETGFDGYWIDMNDPSTGSSPLEDMRFSRGTLSHDAWHNQYALGMAEATKAGIERAKPGTRPFLISRSGFLSQSRHSAVWTGDNMSNPEHLKASIPCSLNLSLSGMPWNGPDVPGFACDADDELMRTWYKAGFLFPFFRNHNIAGAKDQEPWSRGIRTERVVAGCIRARYTLMPYIYNAFAVQEETGDPYMRPLMYHCDEEWTRECTDAFMAGESILHAPVLVPGARERTVILPRGRWFDLLSRRFVPGGRRAARPGDGATPLYFKSASIVPVLPGTRTTNAKDLTRPDFAVFAESGDTAAYRYRSDDGETHAYREGKRTVIDVMVRIEGSRALVETSVVSSGYGSVTCRFFFPRSSGVKTLSIRLGGTDQSMPLSHETLEFCSVIVRGLASAAVTIV